MRTKQFIWTDRDQEGRMGWKPVNMPHFNAGMPVHVAHDVIEHMSDSEHFSWELMAFGATLYGRGVTKGGLIHSHQIEISASDMSEFLIKYKLVVPPTTARSQRKLNNPMFEHQLARLNRATRINIKMAMADHPELKFEVDVDEAVENAACWVRRGFRLSQRLHGRTINDQIATDAAFERIFNDVRRDYNETDPRNGDLLTVKFDRRSKDHSISHTRNGVVVPHRDPAEVEMARSLRVLLEGLQGFGLEAV